MSTKSVQLVLGLLLLGLFVMFNIRTLSLAIFSPIQYLVDENTRRRSSSFLDMSWSSLGDDVSQFETLQHLSDIDFTVDQRLAWINEADKCDDILLYMPYYDAPFGQGCQLNDYFLASLIATYLNKAFVVLENPKGEYPTGSQFGCPIDAFEDVDEYLKSNDKDNLKLVEGFPKGLSRLMLHQKWLTRGCEIPTCEGTYDYEKWEEVWLTNFRRLRQHEPLSEVMFNCTDNGKVIKIMPLGGDLLRIALKYLFPEMMKESEGNSEKFYKWALRLGATSHEAQYFSRLIDGKEIWNFVLALMSRSSYLHLQPWVARDIATYIKSSNLPLDVSYDAVHVRRGDKLVQESQGVVLRYWQSQGYPNMNRAPLNYIPFSHYLKEGWNDENCTGYHLHGTLHNKLPPRLVFVATDDPTTVWKEIDSLPKTADGSTIVNGCHRFQFIFSPAAFEPTPVFHLNGNDDVHRNGCVERYKRSIQAMADFMILTRAEKFVGECNSNWGRVIDTFRFILDYRRSAGKKHVTDLLIFKREFVVAFGARCRT